jgi:RHS repeat-associated protein
MANFTTTIYDSYGRVSATEDALGNFTTILYDAYGRVSATENALGQFSTTIYDSMGRVSANEDALGNFTTTIYDAYGRVSAVEDGLANLTTYVYDSYGRVAAVENALGQFTTTLFDSMGRVSGAENALSQITTTLYDSYGRVAANEDPLGNRTSYVYDGYGRHVATIDPLGNRTTTVLNSLGEEVNEIDAGGNVTTFVYDALGRVTQTITPLGTTTTTYDAVGDLTSQTDPLGRLITYSYDAVGNNIGQTWYNADSSVQNILTFTYDADYNQLTAANNVGTYTMTYNSVGEVTTVQGLWSTLLTFTYDADGNRTGIQDNFGGVTTNSYDAVGNLMLQQFGGTGQTPMRIDLGYDAAGELTSETRYSDLAGTTEVAGTTITYDAAGDLTHQLDKNSSGAPLSSYTYAYDADSRVTSQELNSVMIGTYSYDADSELLSDGTRTQTFDATGNRNGGGNTVSTDNESTSDGTWDYTYDTAGNETYKVNMYSGVTWEYGYDDKNKLISAEEFSRDPRIYDTGLTVLEDVTYKYDAWGNLVERDDGVTSPTVTRYAVDGWNPALAGTTGNTRFNVWADLDGSNDLLTRYFHGDQPDQLFGRQDSLTAYWYLTDRQSSVREVLDNSGNIKDAITYDGSGNITGETNSAYRGSYAWTGRLFDVETDLQYNRAPWYDPATGRWMSQDPLGFDAGDSNLCRYPVNSPNILNDPSGLQPSDADQMALAKVPLTLENLNAKGDEGAEVGQWLSAIAKYRKTTFTYEEIYTILDIRRLQFRFGARKLTGIDQLLDRIKSQLLAELPPPPGMVPDDVQKKHGSLGVQYIENATKRLLFS